MALDKDATIRVGTTGADDVARAAERALRPWETQAAAARSAMQRFGQAVTDTVRQSASDIARGVTAFAAFDFASKVRSAIDYRLAVTQTAVVAGRSADELKDKFAAQEKAILSSRHANEAFARSIGRVTYDYKNAASAADSLGAEAVASNRSLSEMAGIGRTIHEALGSFDGLEQSLGRIRAQAEKVGTVGGPDALRDQIEQLSGAISHLAIKGPDDLAKATAAAAALGKGLRPEQAARAQQTIFGAITSDPRGFERFLGRKITNERGEVEDIGGVIRDIQTKVKRRYGKDAGRVLGLNFGVEAGQALLNYDSGEAAYAAGLRPSKGAQKALTALKDSAAGQFQAAELAKNTAQEGVAEAGLGPAQAALEFAAKHPILGGLGATVLPGLAAKGTSAAVGGLFKLLGLGGAGAGAGGGGGLLAGGTAAAEGGATAGGSTAAAEGGWLTTAGGGAAGSALLAGSLVLAGILGQGKTLVELGRASRAKQGFRVRAIGGEEAEALSARAGGAEAAAAGERSEGLQSAYEIEAASVARRRAVQTGGDAQEQAFTAFKEAKGLGLSDDAAKQLAFSVANAVAEKEWKITIVNATGGPIEALNEQGASASGGQQ